MSAEAESMDQFEVGIAYDLRTEQLTGPAASIDELEEYDSRTTIEAIAGALKANGYRPRLLGGGRQCAETLLARPPDLVFNIAEGSGTRNRESHLPALCEMLGIPYTHSDPLTLGLTLDKPLCKRVIQSCGVPTPAFVVVEKLEDLGTLEFAPYPAFVKPVAEGSSKGIRKTSRVVDQRALEIEVARCLDNYRQPVLVETFLPGVEVTVGVIGNGRSTEIIGLMEIEPRQAKPDEFVYDLETKHNFLVEVAYQSPPKNVTPGTCREIAQLALTAYRVLGCRDVARVDVRLDAQGLPNFIEINPLPGLSPELGDIVILARAHGWTYERLIGRIVAAALGRWSSSTGRPVAAGRPG